MNEKFVENICYSLHSYGVATLSTSLQNELVTLMYVSIHKKPI